MANFKKLWLKFPVLARKQKWNYDDPKKVSEAKKKTSSK